MTTVGVTWIVRLSTAMLIALAATLTAHWFWIFAAPSFAEPPSSSIAESLRPVDAIRRANLFGANIQVSPPMAAGAPTDLVLRGILADRNGGMAIIAVDRHQTVAVRAGEDVAPGIRLQRVRPDHVVVEQHGVRRHLEIAPRKPLDAPPVATPGHGPKK